ncbi:MAG: hypothetical protein JWO91_581, partial [Acidobacteriaceae bacterium]|nr:hypothetical protein [Acidobacteriaceae bacterium]
RQRMAELCAAIAVERDSGKMLQLVRELNRLLEAKQERLERKQEKTS